MNTAMKPLTKAQTAALALFAADMTTCYVRASTIGALLKRGYLALEPLPKWKGVSRPVITQVGRDAAFAALVTAH